MGRVVNPGDDDATTKNKGLSRALDLVELTRRVTRLAVSRLDFHELRSEESGVAIEPKTGWLIEAGLRIEGSRSGWGCKVRFHPPTVSLPHLKRDSRCMQATICVRNESGKWTGNLSE